MANFYEGQDVFITFNLTQSGTKQNIASYKYVVVVKGANGYIAKFATSNTGLVGYGDITLIETNTQGQLQITAEQTKNMKAGKVYGEVLQMDASDYRTIFADTILTLLPSETKSITI